MKAVKRIDQVNEKNRTNAMQQHQELLQEGVGMVKVNGSHKREMKVKLSADDLRGISQYKSRAANTGNYNIKTSEAIHEMIQRRGQLEELVISESGILSPNIIRVDLAVYEELKGEANRYGVTLNDYMRAIFYGLGQAAKGEKSNQIKKQLDATQANRFVHVPLYLSRETREKLYKKHGQMTDDKLKVLVNELALKHLDSL
ncbi:hypothetical protein [Sporosarcina jiandibaonis]|uniref:hypothetical protein n=1 Tax=Sporosarcina jiandibaonis TaxID=2715535 RepID=UPI001555DEA3|nr:hypothetical protein [Sporosarcina jiandibaonis]